MKASAKTDILKGIELRFIMTKFDAFWKSKHDYKILTEMIERMRLMYKGENAMEKTGDIQVEAANVNNSRYMLPAAEAKHIRVCKNDKGYVIVLDDEVEAMYYKLSEKDYKELFTEGD